MAKRTRYDTLIRVSKEVHITLMKAKKRRKADSLDAVLRYMLKIK